MVGHVQGLSGEALGIEGEAGAFIHEEDEAFSVATPRLGRAAAVKVKMTADPILWREEAASARGLNKRSDIETVIVDDKAVLVQVD